MRLFVAIVPPAEVRQEVTRRRRALEAALPACRWVPEANLHLTLAFLGATGSEHLAALDRELGPAFAGHDPFAARAGEPGCFPPGGAPRVLWLALGPGEALAALQTRVAAALRRVLPEREERRRFHPHLTLGRCKAKWPTEAVERWRQGFDALEPAEFRVAEGALVESRLGPGGARYTAVARYPLGAAA
ncbi:MAG: RNA 2',3'-cyclic phosphodiesterase [Thermoanaerobaculia bacterium]|nr:RNA 2',3'-cyclic phosphodiesterase [Thermoanaerobaculia bacterium]